MNFNKQWKFQIGDLKDSFQVNYDDSSWRTLSVPHDWSIEQPYDKEEGDGATAYLTGGIGWYRKNFSLDIKDNQRCFILFDGVYNRSELWINGKELGTHPYGYSPFFFDLTDFLNKDGKDNVLAVKVDRTRYVDSRWYTGSGIYRNVELILTDKCHIPLWGVAIHGTPKDTSNSDVNYRFTLANTYDETREVESLIKLEDPSGKVVAEQKSSYNLSAGEEKEFSLSISVENTKIWDVESPNLYTALQTISSKGEVIGEKETLFGIRSFHFDKDKGFFLNGKNIKIKGVCLHHDAGLVGAAVPADVWRRRLNSLKKGGCNAIRIAHNPASTEFLDLCDEIGFLVQDEFYDEWDGPKDKRKNMNEQHDDYLSRGHAEFFQEWAKFDLQNTILSHRNHASIFQWSIGNEIEWTYPRNVDATGFFGTNANGNYFWNPPPNAPEKIREELNTLPKEQYDIGETAQKLAAWTRELDTTRIVTANCILPSVSFESGYTDALDVVGFSYRRVMYDYSKKHYPDTICMGTENLAQWHEWKSIMERDFIAGTFLWTGIDYMGEAGGSEWPMKGLSCGLLDFAGFEKPSFDMYKSLWNDEPHVSLYTQTEEKSPYKTVDGVAIEKEEGAWEQRLWFWHDVNSFWNYEKGETVIVESYSNCKEAELFLSGKSLGRQLLKDQADHVYKWSVPFEEGELKVVGYSGSSEVIETLVTAGPASGVKLTADRDKLTANGTDCVHITAQLVDAKGNPVTNEDKQISFDVTGPCRYLGLDNGAADNIQFHGDTKITSSKGKALLVLQAGETSGSLNISTSCCGKESDSIKVIVGQ